MARKKTPDILGVALKGQGSAYQKDNDGKEAKNVGIDQVAKDFVKKQIKEMVAEAMDAVAVQKGEMEEIKSHLDAMKTQISELQQDTVDELKEDPPDYKSEIQALAARMEALELKKNEIQPDENPDKNIDQLEEESETEAEIQIEPEVEEKPGKEVSEGAEPDPEPPKPPDPYRTAVIKTIEKMRDGEGLSYEDISKRLENGGMKPISGIDKWDKETVQSLVEQGG